MPWRGPAVPNEFPTLGYLIGEWIEEHCVIPDGDHVGKPYLLTDEQWHFLLWHYRLRLDAKAMSKPREAFRYRRSQLVEPQKWGKGPLAAAMTCAEAEGPVVFDGWDADGEPVGRPWVTPWIQITAASEGQTDNVWRALQPMIELGPLADILTDTGETRINLPGGGRIEPVTASARSRLGQRITFAVQDETHSWVKSNGGIRLADTQNRNLAGMGGRGIETTNAWNPAEQSVAQTTAEADLDDVYRQHPQPPDGSIKNKRELRKMLRALYGQSWWVGMDSIQGEFHELALRDRPQAERFFLNRVVAEADSYFDKNAWDRSFVRLGVHVGDVVCVGFDGSETDDETWLRCCRLSDGYLFTPRFPDGRPMRWRKPDPQVDPDAAAAWHVPRGEVNGAVSHIFETFTVARMYADPPYWQTDIDAWRKRYGDTVVFDWETYRTRQMADALEQLQTDLAAGDVIHDGDPEVSVHIGNAKGDRRTGGTIIVKPGHERKIDAAMSTTLAYRACNDAIAAGWEPPKQPARSFTIA